MSVKTKLKKLWAKQGVRLVLAVLLGVAIGSLATYKLDGRHTSRPSTSGSRSSVVTQKEFAKQAKQRIDSRYKQIQEQLTADVKSKQLTQKQADTLKKELAIAYAFRKALDTTNQADREKLQTKRQEWRNWAKDNNVSYRYFIWLY